MSVKLIFYNWSYVSGFAPIPAIVDKLKDEISTELEISREDVTINMIGGIQAPLGTENPTVIVDSSYPFIQDLESTVAELCFEIFTRCGAGKGFQLSFSYDPPGRVAYYESNGRLVDN